MGEKQKTVDIEGCSYRKILHGRTSRTSLWLADIGLLSVESTGFGFTYIERYRFFAFDEIQGTLYRRNKPHIAKLWVTGIIALICVGFALFYFSKNTTEASVAWAITSSVFLLLFLWELTRGKKIDFYLQTAVQTVKIPAICSKKMLTVFFRKIEPLILARQNTPPPIPAATPTAETKPLGAPPA